jgi:uncharacterized protein
MEERFGSALDLEPVAVSQTGGSGSDGFWGFVAIAWGATWLSSLPLAWSWLHRLPGEPYMFALAGLSAFGPSIAAFVVARRTGRLREVFGRFRPQLPWMVLALVTPWLLHLVARLLEVALGGEVARWLWSPTTSAQIAALFCFSVGEEFGWRGFAHPILLRRYGPVFGPLILGAIWGVWHLMYCITPDGMWSPQGFALLVFEFMLWSPIIAWLYERTQRSMAVAIAIHAGAHLDNSARITADEGRLQALVFLVLGIAAALAARSLARAYPRRVQALPRPL